MTAFSSRSFSTADLVDEHGDQLWVCDTQFRQFGGERVFSGRVRTVACYQDNRLAKQVLATPGEGAVLVIDGRGSLHTALSGDLIARSAADHGWAGLVINGAVRDSAVLAGLPIGIKALGTTPRKSAKAGTGQLDVPVGFGGITFHPGDLLYADDDGVVLLAG
ncbi:ribonuclease E activity regulator RraA [Amycolatopsis viridis]|uniref:4-hydroxy-4-methyl-2-oxoglutarate aldolase n=1 Tax=Amycolatopsis viridis TaxID=185678 RepID=A0ABX0SWX9_9PSEU|nr:ribonuclease E activity regulator RraA [Amycolatopsis viridis]NIH79836.1 regulator of ribonuclease activity A [Amycolatopsis viridis]